VEVPVGSARGQGLIRKLSTESALKRLGLRFFAEEVDPEAALVWAAVAVSDRGVSLDDANAESLEAHDGSTLPTGFLELHRSGIETRKFFTQSNDGARFGSSVYGAIWSPGLRIGVFAHVDFDTELVAPLLGFSYTEPLLFTSANLKRLCEVLRNDDLGAAAGVERITNYAPELIPESFFVNHYLDHYEKYRSDPAEPFVLIYKEFCLASEISATIT
jgi:hypothetical protein